LRPSAGGLKALLPLLGDRRRAGATVDSLSFSFVAVTVIGTLEGSEAMRSLRWLWLRLRLLLLRTTFLPFRGLRRVLLGYLVSRGSVLDVPRAALEKSDSRGDKHDEFNEEDDEEVEDKEANISDDGIGKSSTDSPTSSKRTPLLKL